MNMSTFENLKTQVMMNINKYFAFLKYLIFRNLRIEG